jgi:hypothetical protein
MKITERIHQYLRCWRGRVIKAVATAENVAINGQTAMVHSVDYTGICAVVISKENSPAFILKGGQMAGSKLGNDWRCTATKINGWRGQLYCLNYRAVKSVGQYVKL